MRDLLLCFLPCFLACGSEPPEPSCPGGTDTSDLTPLAVAAPRCALTNAVLDVPYLPDEPFRVDLYRPATGSGPFRTIVWIHGGGWRNGDEDQVIYPSRMLCHGWAIASVSYRLTPSGARFPAPLHDIKAAIRFLRANATTYDLDPDRFVAWGDSAGGHLAALVGTSGGVPELEDLTQGNADQPSTVSAVVDFYGPSDLSQLDAQLLAEGVCPESAAQFYLTDSPPSELLGCSVTDPACAGAVAAANPITYVDADDPPFLLLHGTHDCVAARGQSRLLGDALRAEGVCVSERSVVDAEHGGLAWVSAPVQDTVAAFLDAVVP